MVDPGFPVGGMDLVGGRELPRRLRFKNFICQNERTWTLGEGRAPGTPPRSAGDNSHAAGDFTVLKHG